MSGHIVLAFDLGASTGRAIRGGLKDGRLQWKEVHRFENIPVEQDGTLCWNMEQLMDGVREGIRLAGNFDSLAFDTWGVDFGLIGTDGALIAPPVHYRDPRTRGMVEKVLHQVKEETVYRLTGNQIMEINTLFQLYALRQQHPEQLAKAKHLLFMPDMFSYLLCGKAVCEQTIASTSQMLSPETGQWQREILDKLDIPAGILLPVTPSAKIIGSLPSGEKVIAVAGHDTQCAVAAVPASAEHTAFLSCGTWSLMGTELDQPILTAQSAALGFSNERGADGKAHFLKNIIGLWLVQESRREWERQGKHFSFAELETMASTAPPFVSMVDPDDPMFVSPGDLPGRIQTYCRNTGQPVPQSPGEVVRCIYESLALKYSKTLEELSALTGKTFSALHIIGGGAQARLLCQMTAESCNLPVLAGPQEASALGNMLLQLIALGDLQDTKQARSVIQATEESISYLPVEPKIWQEVKRKYKQIQNEKENANAVSENRDSPRD